MEKKKKKKHKKKKKNTVVQVLENDSKFSLFEVIILILISVIFGILIGYLITYGNSNLSRVRSDTSLGEIVSTYNNIVDNYYDDLDEEKLSESAIRGMLSSLEDPYSLYLDKASTTSFQESIDGEYVGIGITVEFKEHYNHIISIVKGGPAEKAGLQVGDIILMIDGKSCEGLYSADIRKMVDGKVGSNVQMTIQRDGQKKNILVTRQTIDIQNVDYRLIQEDGINIGYIRIKIFSSNSSLQFQEALKELESKDIQSLMIDIRDNPGGHLQQTRNILSLFFSKKTILYQIEANGKREKVYSLSDEKRKYPIVLLVNQETASSAEVMASCFQDNYSNIHLVGTRTYGKGFVQKSIPLHNGSSIKFTVQKWLTPKGKLVGEEGILPDVYVEQDPTFYVEESSLSDTQYQKAISILK